MMAPFWRGRSERLHEARVADLKEAHQTVLAAHKMTIEAMAEQVEYLRSLLGRAQPTQLRTFPEPPQRKAPLHISDEEEDVRHAHSAGLIDGEELAAELARLGIDVESD